jgi:23S rRNA pseudouridine1911/1915/1917 synthase
LSAPGSGGDPLRFQVLPLHTERLDRFLADQLSLSRTHAARLVGLGAVLVNEKVARSSRTLERGDVVTVTLPADTTPPRTLVPHPFPLTAVYEDDDLLVLDKPAGLVVHPAPGHWTDTLLNALVARGTALSSGAGRPGIVHRLDRDTSGLLLVAKHDVAHRRLSHAIGLRRVERTYAALVWGHIAKPITIDAPIARHSKDRKRMAVLARGRPARTSVERVARFDVCDLVRVKLETGRTHQIRVHLAHIGHPVVGDPVYGGGGARRLSGSAHARATVVEQAVSRQALHAAQLAFAHPVSRQWQVARAEWPDDLRPVIAAAAEDPALLARPNVLEYLGFFQ